MTPPVRPLAPRLRGLLRRSAGTTTVEFAVVLAVFVFLFFGLIDFGRLAFSYVMAEKAVQRAARLAAVRPPVCAGVPQTHLRPDSASALPVADLPRFGTACRAGTEVCADPGDFACAGGSDATSLAVWRRIDALLPPGASAANLRFVYSHDPELGFLGGPYVPVVTVELRELTYSFTSPLGAMAALAGAAGPSGLGADFVFPPLSASLPGEDLAAGASG